jgi:hypothetical protein
MDGQRFDELTKTLAAGLSRRAILKAMAGGALGGVLALAGIESAWTRPARKPKDPKKFCFGKWNVHCGSGCCASDHACYLGGCVPHGGFPCGNGYCTRDEECTNGTCQRPRCPSITCTSCNSEGACTTTGPDPATCACPACDGYLCHAPGQAVCTHCVRPKVPSELCTQCVECPSESMRPCNNKCIPKHMCCVEGQAAGAVRAQVDPGCGPEGCLPGLADCDGDGACETTLGTDGNCSGCGDTCTGGKTCGGGSCQCPSGADCGGTCTTLGTDSNCSGCGDACTGGKTCQGGGCACPASAPEVCQGACHAPCGEGQSRNEGTCACEGGGGCAPTEFPCGPSDFEVCCPDTTTCDASSETRCMLSCGPAGSGYGCPAACGCEVCDTTGSGDPHFFACVGGPCAGIYGHLCVGP